jgi:hypothetical protein
VKKRRKEEQRSEDSMMNKQIFLLAVFAVLSFATIMLTVFPLETVYAFVTAEATRSEPKAPMAVSGENVYLVWWTNKTGNWEVMFRASTDNGATFGDKINLSNSTETDSENAEIVATGDNVYVSWWENSLQNRTSESVMRVSTDNGATFGTLLMLGSNGTLSPGGEEGGEGEGGE